MYPIWQHTPIGKPDVKGFNDPGMQTFASDPIKSITRESCQNSTDAGNKSPVQIKYKLHSISPDNIPGGRIEIQHFMEQCLSTWKDDKKAKNFFNKAIKLLMQETIKVLVISDYNTTGASGTDDDQNSPWFSMVHATGATSKGEGAGGSFGIGKDSFFESSEFRIIFYTTVTDEEANEISFAGRTKLPSYKEGENYKSGNGIFGMERQTAIKKVSAIPEFFRRSERGTSIFIIGYASADNGWEAEIIKSVVSNFYVAIHDEDLIVEVGDTFINKSNLASLIKEHCTEEEDYTNSYYLAYVSEKSDKLFKFNDELNNLGKVELHVIVDGELPKTVQYMRKNKMVIYESGYRVLRMPFAGLFICKDVKGNKILRDMEPPSHDAWEKKRSPKGFLIDNEYKEWIRKCLKEIAPSVNAEAQDIEDLYKWLPYDEQFEENKHGDSNISAGTPTQEETIFERLKPSDEKCYEPEVNKPTSGYSEKGEDNAAEEGKEEGSGGGGGEEGNGGGGTGGGSGTGTGDGIGGNGSKSSKRKSINIPVRAFTISKTNGSVEYLLKIKSNKTVKANLLIKAVGEDIEDQAVIEDVKEMNGKPHVFHGSWINDVELIDNKSIDYKIKIKSKLQLKLKIEVYEQN
jgi:hypothetical protein